MNGVIDYNWLGIAFISDDLPQKVHKAIEKRWMSWKRKSMQSLTSGLMSMG